MAECNVRVICRFRPISEGEKVNEKSVQTPYSLEYLTQHDKRSIVVHHSNKTTETQVFSFDKTFWDTSSTQEEIFEAAAKDLVGDVLNGYNATILAYGQTGSGKSWTMFGPNISDTLTKGIIPRAIRLLFQSIDESKDGTVFNVRCSFLEVYKEVVKDLLQPKNANLKVRQAPIRGVWVDSLTEQYVETKEEAIQILTYGERFRASTLMNSNSSRSHCLFTLTLSQKLSDGSTKESKFNFGDLAGSERVNKTGASGDTLEEAKKINQSLSALGNVINALTKPHRPHVPYRDSKLTHILKESLGGNCKTTLVITCSPHKYNIEETLSTLQFGQRAKMIKNKVVINKQKSPVDLQLIIERLMKELSELKAYVITLEDELKSIKGKEVDVNKLKANTTIEDEENLLQEVELQVELDKLQGTASIQIQELKEELEQAAAQEKEYLEELMKLRRQLENEQEINGKQIEELTKKNEMQAERINKLQYELKEAQLEVDRLNAEMALMKANDDINNAKYQLGSMEFQIPREEVQEMVRKHSEATEKLQEQKDSKIKAQEKEIIELQNKLEITEHQNGVGSRALLEMESRYKQAMEWYEEAERRASRVKIIRNVKKSSSITDAFSSGAKNISRASIIEERIDKEGYLTKMGGVVRFVELRYYLYLRNWQKRWFVMKGGFLLYFKEKGEFEPKGSIPLEDCLVLDAFSDTKKEFSFGIYNQTGKRTFFLCAENNLEKLSWMKAIQQRIDHLSIDSKKVRSIDIM